MPYGRAHAEALLAQLASTLGLSDLSLDADGTLILRVDGELTIFVGVEKDERHLSLLASLPDSYGPKPPEFLEALLMANFMWRETGGATLAIDGENGPVTLQCRLPLSDLTYPAFEQELNGFVSTASAWHARALVAVVAAKAGASPSDEAGAADSDENWIRA